MSLEQVPQQKNTGLDMSAFMALQAGLLYENHSEWDEPTGKVLAEHADDMKSFGVDFRTYVEKNPQILDEYINNPTGTIQKLKDRFYH